MIARVHVVLTNTVLDTVNDSPIGDYTHPKDHINIPDTYCCTYRTRKSGKSLVWVVIDIERFWALINTSFGEKVYGLNYPSKQR